LVIVFAGLFRPWRPFMPAKGKKNTAVQGPLGAPPGGPYLQMAFFCERVLVESDGVVSFIRQIDRLTTNASGPSAPATMPATNYSAFLALAMKSGTARGSFEMQVVRERPSGIRDGQPVFTLTIFFEGEDRGVGVYGPISLNFEEEGLYWFDVLLDGTLMTRMPFRVIYQRVAAGRV
jgi:hypothetical protein